MSYSSGRAQVEPLAALAAVFAVAVGLALYAGAIDATLPRLTPDRDVAPAAADRFTSEASSFGVVEPPLTGPVEGAKPAGYELNATLATADGTWAAGPPRPPVTECERRAVTVRVAPGRLRPGRLEVCAWRER